VNRTLCRAPAPATIFARAEKTGGTGALWADFQPAVLRREAGWKACYHQEKLPLNRVLSRYYQKKIAFYCLNVHFNL